MFTQIAKQITRYYKESKMSLAHILKILLFKENFWFWTQLENLNSFLVSKFMAKIHYTESLGEFPIRRVSICIVYGNFSTKFILSKKPLHLYILCLFVHLFVCLFVIDDRQNGWTDWANFFLWDLAWPQGRFVNDRLSINLLQTKFDFENLENLQFFLNLRNFCLSFF